MAIVEVYLGNTVATDISRKYLGNTLAFERGGGGFDPLIDDYLAKCTLEGYTAASGSELTALNQFILDLVSFGIINEVESRTPLVSNYLDILKVYSSNSSGDSDAATLNLLDVDTFQSIKVNAPDYGAGGFSGTAGGGYINTNHAPDDGTLFTTNDRHLGWYFRTINSIETAGNFHGAASGVNGRAWIFPQRTDNLAINAALNSNNVSISTTSADGLAHHIINRDNGSNFLDHYYRGSLNDQKSVLYTALHSFPFFIGAYNNAGTATGFGNAECAIFHKGGNIAPKAADMYTAVQTYLTSIGQQV